QDQDWRSLTSVALCARNPQSHRHTPGESIRQSGSERTRGGARLVVRCRKIAVHRSQLSTAPARSECLCFAFVAAKAESDSAESRAVLTLRWFRLQDVQ